MIVRILLPGSFHNILGTVERQSASGGVWVRPAEWPAGEADEFGGLMWFEMEEVESAA